MKRKAMVCLLCLLLLLPAACADTRPGQNGQVQESGYEQISQEEAKKLMDTREDALVLDVRTEAEYEEAHIPGAVCVPNESIQDTMPEELPDKEQLTWCIAAAETGASRQPKNWQIWDIPM